uniref:Secreted protein n=1 Tax=Ciona savignyi TaxID=51511 RepID=H2Z896_CIOSA
MKFLLVVVVSVIFVEVYSVTVPPIPITCYVGRSSGSSINLTDFAQQECKRGEVLQNRRGSKKRKFVYGKEVPRLQSMLFTSRHHQRAPMLQWNGNNEKVADLSLLLLHGYL